MVPPLSSIIIVIRVLLEVVTVGGIVSGTFIKKKLYQKIIFATLAIIITFIWAKYGAPKSPTVLTGNAKLILELIVYSLETLAYFGLFDPNIGTIYLVIASLNLCFKY